MPEKRGLAPARGSKLNETKHQGRPLGAQKNRLGGDCFRLFLALRLCRRALSRILSYHGKRARGRLSEEMPLDHRRSHGTTERGGHEHGGPRRSLPDIWLGVANQHRSVGAWDASAFHAELEKHRSLNSFNVLAANRPAGQRPSKKKNQGKAVGRPLSEAAPREDTERRGHARGGPRGRRGPRSAEDRPRIALVSSAAHLRTSRSAREAPPRSGCVLACPRHIGGTGSHGKADGAACLQGHAASTTAVAATTRRVIVASIAVPDSPRSPQVSLLLSWTHASTFHVALESPCSLGPFECVRRKHKGRSEVSKKNWRSRAPSVRSDVLWRHIHRTCLGPPQGNTEDRGGLATVARRHDTGRRLQEYAVVLLFPATR